MRFPALVFLMLFAFAAPASAIDVGMQDDQIMLHGAYDRDLALDQFVAMGGTHVRINVSHKESKSFEDDTDFGLKYPIKQYDAAVNAVRSHGLKVQLTLIWNRRDDPAFVAAWMGNLANHFGKRVNRYSVFNEPDLSVPTDGTCDGRGQKALARRYPSKVVVNDLGKLVAKGVLVKGKNVTLEQACRQFIRGQAYRTAFNPSARAIHRANPDATVLAGETSGTAGLEWFIRGAYLKPMPEMDGWAHHPFQFDLTPQKPANGWGIGNLKKFKRMVKTPVYVTEFGYPHPNSSMDKRLYGRRLTYQQIAKALPKAWAVAKQAGVKQMLQYQWYRKPPYRTEYWETALNITDDGKTSPAYKALKRLILDW